jgi:hypothetical protein
MVFIAMKIFYLYILYISIITVVLLLLLLLLLFVVVFAAAFGGGGGATAACNADVTVMAPVRLRSVKSGIHLLLWEHQICF